MPITPDSMAPVSTETTMSGMAPICTKVTSLPGSIPWRLTYWRATKSSVPPNRVTPMRLPRSCATSVIEGWTITEKRKL